MPSRRTWFWTTIVLGIVYYRSADVFKNSIIVRSPLPTGYIAGGNYASDCKTVRDPAHDISESANSCEDATFWDIYDANNNIVQRPVILTCDPNRKHWNTVMGPLKNPEPRGGLWIYSPPLQKKQSATSTLSLEPGKAHRMEINNMPPDHDFHPLGIAIWPSYAGNKSYAYVVNHAREKTIIDQFILDPKNPLEAHYLRSIISPLFVSPNALALTSPNSFYVSNDHLVTRRWPIIGHFLPLIESLLALPLGFVSHVTLHSPATYYNNPIAEQRLAKLFIPFPNGVAVSHKGDSLAISSTTLGKIYIYERDPSTNALIRQKTKTPITVPFTPDNLHWTFSLEDPMKEELIVAGHPNFPDLSKVAADKPGSSAGSWVVAISFQEEGTGKVNTEFDLEAPVPLSSKLSKDGLDWSVQTIFQSHGDEEKGGFMSSATGLRDPETGAVYVSGLYARDGMLVCQPGSRAN